MYMLFSVIVYKYNYNLYVYKYFCNRSVYCKNTFFLNINKIYESVFQDLFIGTTINQTYETKYIQWRH